MNIPHITLIDIATQVPLRGGDRMCLSPSGVSLKKELRAPSLAPKKNIRKYSGDILNGCAPQTALFLLNFIQGLRFQSLIKFRVFFSLIIFS